MYNRNSLNGLSTRSRFLWGTLSAISRLGINFVATIVLSRLLLPSDYGIIGMMAIVISVSEIIIDAGLGGAIVKKKTVKSIDLATLTTYNIVVSLLLYVAIYFLAPLLADLYNVEALIFLLRIYALTIVIESFSIVPKVLVLKNLMLKQYALTNLISGVLGLVVAIILAFCGLGVYSLIYQYIISAMIYGVLIYKFSGYRISIGFSCCSFKELFIFGVNTTSANILRSISENIYNNIVAKVASLNIAGYYSQSYKLQGVVGSVQNSIIDSVLFPILCKEKGSLFERARNLNNIVTFIFTNLCFLLMLNSKEIIIILLGDNWVGMDLFLKPLFLVGIIQAFTSLYRNTLKSLGKTFDIFKVEIWAFIIAIPFYIYLFKSKRIEYIVCLFLCYSIIRMYISICYLSTNFNIPRKSIFLDLIKQFLIPLPVYVVFSFANFFLEFGAIIRLCLMTSFYLFSVIGLYECFHVEVYRKIKEQVINFMK